MAKRQWPTAKRIMSLNTEPIIGIFIKYPTQGQVKTRLAKDTSPQFATDLYRAFVEDICEQLSGWKTPFALIFSPDSSEEMIKNWLPYKVPCFKQECDDLGERLIHAFNRLYLT